MDSPPSCISRGIVICILHLYLSGIVVGVSVEIRPSRVSLHHVTHSYPDTLWRRMMSPVPRRPNALSDIRLDFSNEFCILTGPSSAGKSTIFRLIQGKETPTISGTVQIVSAGTPKRFSLPSKGVSIESAETENRSVDSPVCIPLPVLLDEKPSPDLHKSPRQHLLHRNVQESTRALTKVLLHIFDVTDCIDIKYGDLSQSQLYLMKLVEASLESMTKNLPKDESPVSAIRREDDDDDGHHTWVYPAPILLLDEWLDKETSLIIQSVQSTLQQVCQVTGSVTVCATHVPDRFQQSDCRHVMLRNGRLLNDDSVIVSRQSRETQR